MKNKFKTILLILLCFFLVLGGAFGIYFGMREYYKKIYPCAYTEYVHKYSIEYNIDENFLYAIIKTESDFNTKAISKDGARGLMQIMPSTYEWIKSKNIDDKNHTYDNMFEPQMNIKYGTYLISSLYSEFGSFETSLAAYHAGRGKTQEWLNDPKFSSDKKTLHTIEYKETEQYVKKVINAYNHYKNLYKK